MKRPKNQPPAILDRAGRNIAALRMHARMSQADLAKKIRKNPSYVSLIEAGKRTIDIVLAERFANVLGVSIGTLLEAESLFETLDDGAQRQIR